MSIPDNAIAVVGMAGKFPGANDLSTFWSNLSSGKESIVTLSEQELRDEGVSEQTLANPAYVRRAPLLDAIDEFDADYFGFSPLAAQVLDPQHRLFLQCAWHALEDAGCDPAQYDGSIGVYGTSSPSGYLLHNLLSHRDPNAVLAEGLNFDQFSLFLQNDKDFLTTRISLRVRPARPEHRGADGMLVVAGCGSPGLLEPAQRRMRHGTGGRLLPVHPAPRRLLELAGIDGVGGWPLPAVRCAGRRHGLRQRSSPWWLSSRCRPPSTPGIASSRHPRFGDQQRRIDEDGLRGTQPGRSSRCHRRSARRIRRRCLDRELCRDPRNRHPAR